MNLITSFINKVDIIRSYAVSDVTSGFMKDYVLFLNLEWDDSVDYFTTVFELTTVIPYDLVVF